MNLGSDLLAGTGIAKYTVLRTLVNAIQKEKGNEFDYVLIDLPPSFGNLVRAAICISDYILIPCTSDTFSKYCIGLIGQMWPQFIVDWNTGISRFKQTNYAMEDYDDFGKPKFGGWIFNGFDTRAQKMLRGDQAHESEIASAIRDDLIVKLRTLKYGAVSAQALVQPKVGGIEDMNVLVQNSLWLNVPVPKLRDEKQVRDLAQSASWSDAQVKLIDAIADQFSELAENVVAHCP